MSKQYSDCHAGHPFHEKINAYTILGDMLVYDWEKYKDQASVYCTGQDDISRTLKNSGVWELLIYPLFTSILENGNKENIVVDIGSNVGWYSRIAAQLGYRVLAYDGNQEHAELTKQNVPKANVEFIWFDKDTKSIGCDADIEILKCDIEGNEQFAVKAFDQMLSEKRINNIIIEISPTFNDSYPELVSKIIDYGYLANEIGGSPFDFNWNFAQKDLWFKKL